MNIRAMTTSRRRLQLENLSNPIVETGKLHDIFVATIFPCEIVEDVTN